MPKWRAPDMRIHRNRESSGRNGNPMQSPSVSVIIPAYNASNTLQACLRSVHAAEYDGEVEVIVVDDASTDATPAIAEELGCRVIRRVSNAGPAVSRNAGAKAAKGEILIFVDADTQMRPDTIRAGVSAFTREDIGAVSGIYELEPVNSGFFPCYYAYLKYHAFMATRAEHSSAFGAQCAAISKRLFEQVGGFRSLPWGMDLENDELGWRINQRSKIAISRAFRVRHNFPDFRKLMFIFTERVYWWTQFSWYARRGETVLMTRGFGSATAALPAAVLCVLLASFVSAKAWSTGLYLSSAALSAMFVSGYVGFWRLCLRRRGMLFATKAALASALFSFVLTFSALRGYLAYIRLALCRKKPPFASVALGKV